MQKTKLLLFVLLVLLCGCLLFCGCEKADVSPDEPEMPDEPGTPNEPENDLYTFEFISDGNGTCRITNIVFLRECTEDFTLVIPEKSPEGDVVVGLIDWLERETTNYLYRNIPRLLTEKSYNELLAKMQSNGIPEDQLNIFMDYYYHRVDLSSIEDEEEKKLWLIDCPPAQFAVLYLAFGSSSSYVHIDNNDQKNLSTILTEYASYTEQDKERANEEIFALVKENLSEDEYYFSGYRVYPREFLHLTAVEFPESFVSGEHKLYFEATHQGLNYFAGCEKLTSLTNYTTGEKYVLEDNVLYSEDKTVLKGVFKYYRPAYDSVTGEYVPSQFVIPNTVVRIDNQAFFGCTYLDEVTIPNSVQSIGAHAFGYCTHLTNASISENITAIDQYAFSGSGLTSIVLHGKLKEIPRNLFFECVYLQEAVILDGTQSIGSGAFESCEKLTSIEIPNSVTVIGSLAFEECSSLVKVVLPDKLEKIERFLFGKCVQLEEVVIPDSVVSIDQFAFTNCPSLKKVVIPKNVSSIHPWMYNDSNMSIHAFEVAKENPYYRIEGDCLIHIETQTAIMIGGANIPAGIKHIGDYAFMFTADTICVPYGVTTIGSDGFGNGYETNIHLYLPNTLTKIDISFSDNEFLKTITFIGTEEEWNAIEKGEGWEGSEGEYTLVFMDVTEYYLEQARRRHERVTVSAEIAEGVERIPGRIKKCEDVKKRLENAKLDPNASDAQKKQLERNFHNALSELWRTVGSMIRSATQGVNEYEFISLALQIVEEQGDVAAAQEIVGYKAEATECLAYCKEVLPQAYNEVMGYLKEAHSGDVDTKEQQSLLQDAYDEWLRAFAD